MKKIIKRITKSSAFHKLICRLISIYINLVYYTSRRFIEVDEAALPYFNGEKNAIFCFWHGRLLMIAKINPPHRTMNVLISTHSDGEIISGAMHNFGFQTIRGSSTRGGVAAVINSIKALENRENVCITPDGPRGPAMQVQEGIIAIAKKTGLPIIPLTYSCSHKRFAKSWDRFLIAFPLGRLYYKIGKPLINPDKDELEAAMIKLTEDIDKLAS